MTADDVLIEVGIELVRAFAGRPYIVEVRRHPAHGLELQIKRDGEPDSGDGDEVRAYLNPAEVLEFPHLGRIATAVGDVEAYVDALEGHPDGARLGRIPAGRIPAFDEALLEGKVNAPGSRRYGPGEVLG